MTWLEQEMKGLVILGGGGGALGAFNRDLKCFTEIVLWF